MELAALSVPQEVAAEVSAGGFEEPTFFGDVAGARFDPSAPTFAAVARTGGATARLGPETNADECERV